MSSLHLVAGAIAQLRFDRPDKYNAIDIATWLVLPKLIYDAVSDAQTRVIVLSGSGGNFAAGADIDEFDDVFADRTATLAYLDAMAKATAAIATAPIPVIALVDGLCLGAGVAVALSCDLRIGTPISRYAITPAKLGLAYSLADTKRVVDAVGATKAKDLLFTGRLIGANEALMIGLIDEIAENAVDKAEQIAALSSWTHTRTKAMVRRLLDGYTAETEQTRSWFAEAPQGPDFAEGVAAFRAKRKPVFPARQS